MNKPLLEMLGLKKKPVTTCSGTVTRIGFAHPSGETQGYFVLVLEGEREPIKFLFQKPRSDLETLALTMPGDQLTLTIKGEIGDGWCHVVGVTNTDLMAAIAVGMTR
jgi:hypothetical protein